MGFRESISRDTPNDATPASLHNSNVQVQGEKRKMQVCLTVYTKCSMRSWCWAFLYVRLEGLWLELNWRIESMLYEWEWDGPNGAFSKKKTIAQYLSRCWLVLCGCASIIHSLYYNKYNYANVPGITCFSLWDFNSILWNIPDLVFPITHSELTI